MALGYLIVLVLGFALIFMGFVAGFIVGRSGFNVRLPEQSRRSVVEVVSPSAEIVRSNGKGHR